MYKEKQFVNFGVMLGNVLCTLLVMLSLGHGMGSSNSHDFHTSWMTISLDEERKEMTMEWRTDTEHFEHVLSKHHGSEVRLDMPNLSEWDDVIESYVNSKCDIKFNNRYQKFRVEIVEVDIAEVKITFVPIKCRRKLKEVSMTNTLLLAQFPGQKNMVQINYKGQQISYVFQYGSTSFTKKIKE